MSGSTEKTVALGKWGVHTRLPPELPPMMSLENHMKSLDPQLHLAINGTLCLLPTVGGGSQETQQSQDFLSQPAGSNGVLPPRCEWRLFGKQQGCIPIPPPERCQGGVKGSGTLHSQGRVTSRTVLACQSGLAWVPTPVSRQYPPSRLSQGCHKKPSMTKIQSLFITMSKMSRFPYKNSVVRPGARETSNSMKKDRQ